jgi:MOSC domain-containing protein YiiM
VSKILAVCISEDKGTKKEPVSEGVLREGYGLVNDAHAELDTHRQVSLLAIESINRMREAGFDVAPGDFAENLTTEGLDLASLPVGTGLQIGKGITLEVTQIGKDCHTGCAIFREVGKCIMPKEGVFARVLRGGVVRPGDELIERETSSDRR